jgi:predicted metal-dependent hydrolase
MSKPAPRLKEAAVHQRWQSAEEFKNTARAWAKKIRVKPARIQVQRMTQKWASCSPGGVVTFSTDLLGEDRAFGEAVIVHELIHLKVPNHGPVFRSLLKAYLPKGAVPAVDPENRRLVGQVRPEPSQERRVGGAD